MKTKHLFAALALPCVFAACSQDDFADSKNVNKNIPENAISGLTLNITKDSDGVGTRADWQDNGSKITFDKGDKVSLYWLGESDGANSYKTAAARTALDGKFNSIFRTEDSFSFTSESLVFVGGNVAVFPGDISFVKEGEVVIKVPAEQDDKTQDNIPYISNQLWIEKQGDDQTEQLPGYYGDKQLDCPVKQAANMVNLTLDLSNIPAGFDFEVQSVELVTTGKSTGKAFATESKVTTLNAAPTHTGDVISENTTEVNTIVAQTWSAPSAKADVLKTTSLTKKDDKTVVAHFVILPTDAALDTDFEGAKIIVRTNCGTVTIASDATGATGDALKNPIIDKDGAKVVIGTAIETFVKTQTSTEDDSKFKGESIGKTFRRTLAVDLSNAELTGSIVYTSADIIRYAGLYKAFDKKDALNLVMASKAKDNKFSGLTKEAVEAFHALATNGGPAFTLTPAKSSSEDVTTIEIVGGGAVYDIPELAANNVALALTAEEWTMQDALALDDQITSIENNGTLTVEGTDGKEVAAKIVNNGLLKIGGNNKVILNAFESTLESIVDIEAGQELNFATAVDAAAMLGTINVKDMSSKLTIKDAIVVVNSGIINNFGTVASAGTANGLTNEGEIYVKGDAAITYVQDNENGTIYLNKRTDEVKVESTAKGKVVYEYNLDTDGAIFEQKANDKFTYVIFNNVGALTLKADAATTDMEFGGICTLVANDKTIQNLTVSKGANLRLLTGNKLTVTDLTNKGTITIGGTINYSGTYTAEGDVLSVGGGAITNI